MSLPVADQVRALEAAMRQMPGQLDVDELTSHHFCEGLYARQLFVPAGAALVGKTHAQQNLFLLVQGEMTITTESGPRLIVAPFMVVTQPGTKRAGYAHSDCICLNIHPNTDNEHDLEVLESRYITPEALPAPEAKELLE